jgi:hypothetical protein
VLPLPPLLLAVAGHDRCHNNRRRVVAVEDDDGGGVVGRDGRVALRGHIRHSDMPIIAGGRRHKQCGRASISRSFASRKMYSLLGRAAL